MLKPIDSLIFIKNMDLYVYETSHFVHIGSLAWVGNVRRFCVWHTHAACRRKTLVTHQASDLGLTLNAKCYTRFMTPWLPGSYSHWTDLTPEGTTSKFHKTSPHINTYKYFFVNRTVNLWNQLPSHIVNSCSVNVFKNRIDSHLHKYMFTTNIDIYTIKV